MLKTAPSLRYPNAKHTGSLLVCDGADFDSTDRLEKAANLTSISDSKSGIFSTWFRFDGSDASPHCFLYGDAAAVTTRGIYFGREGGKLYLADNNGQATILLLSTTSYLANAAWHHLLAAWDGATGAMQLYVDGVSDLNAGASHSNNVSINYSGCDRWRVGRTPDNSSQLNGCLAELYFAPGQWLDITDSKVRSRFWHGGKPSRLDSDGKAPTGTAPHIYLHLDDGEAVANLATNRGSGGNFTVSGTLATASTSPSD